MTWSVKPQMDVVPANGTFDTGHQAEECGMPPLPAEARLDPGLAAGACPWLDDYVAFSRQWSPRAYDGFHEAVGLWVLSTVAAGRVMMHFGGERFTSLYIALVARTSLFTKTTTADIGLQTLEDAGLDWLLLGDSMTPQKFIRDLAGQVPADYDSLSPRQQAQVRAQLALSGQRGWYYEEFGQQLAAMMRQNSFMADFRSLLRRMADHREEYAYGTVSRGVDTVERPYLALLANLTPAELHYYARPGSALWQDGFYARFAFVAPPPYEEAKQGMFPKGERCVPSQVVKPLVAWHERLGMPAVQIAGNGAYGGVASQGCRRVERGPARYTGCTATPEVIDAFYIYHDGLLRTVVPSQQTDLDGNYARLSEKALRIAMLMASLEGGDRIEMRHWARAQEIAERWRAGLHHVVGTLAEPKLCSGERDEDRVLRHLERLCGQGQAPTARDIRVRIRGITTPQVEHILGGLVRSGAVGMEMTGRTNRYYVPGSSGALALGKVQD